MSWFQDCYIRLLIDNHVTDVDPSFMTGFDPTHYVKMVKRGGIEAAMVYACDHNGNCYYPTKVGHMHANLNGRDIFGETVGLLRNEGIVPIAYTTVIFHNHSAKTNPGWRQENQSGSQHAGRYWHSCPNSVEYREYAKAELSEVISYDVDGVFIDMLFWPIVCVCSNCRSKYLRETGREIPHVIDWSNPEWVSFQRARERWMVEFVDELTACVKSQRPDITLTHQFSPVMAGWACSASPGIAVASAFASGDFYGGRCQQALATKVFSAFSRNMPYEFMTSRCVNLGDHTSTKSEEEMTCHASLTLANGGACFFIDAINPDGTLCPSLYDRLGRVTSAVRPFADRMKSTNPKLAADTGLYFSMPSQVDFRDNGTDLSKQDGENSNMQPSSQILAHRDVLGASALLGRANIPYRVVTNGNPDMSGLRTLIVNSAAFMSPNEVAAIREFVRDGGTLIATGCTSLYDTDGVTAGDLQLSDVFGVSFSGKISERISYLTYTGQMDGLPEETGCTQHIVTDTPSPLVTATTGQVLAQVSGPYFAPGDAEQYASIHSNPPGPVTEYAGMTVNSFGLGKCIYLYSPLFAMQNESHQAFGEKLFGKYAASELVVSCNAPRCVEVTVLQSADKDRLFLCFVNYQIELPNVPVRDVSASLRVPGGRRPSECTAVSNRQTVNYDWSDGVISVSVPVLETLEMVEIVLAGE